AIRIERIPSEKVTVIPNGVDLTRFAPGDRVGARKQWHIAQTARVVAAVGRLSPEKGHQYLLQALADIKNKVPGLVCLLAGDGPLRQQLEAEARSLGIQDVCQFLGDVPQVEQVFAAADVVVLPSLFEGMPNAVLEAMASGRAVVASGVGGA